MENQIKRLQKQNNKLKFRNNNLRKENKSQRQQKNNVAQPLKRTREQANWNELPWHSKLTDTDKDHRIFTKQFVKAKVKPREANIAIRTMNRKSSSGSRTFP